jgi:ribosomal-protein-alanine N-acetyltransferase
MKKLEIKFYHTLDSVIPGESQDTLNGCYKRKLYLLPLSHDGLNEMHEYSMNEKLYEYLYYKPFTKISETKAYLSKLLDAQGSLVEGRTSMGWFIRRLDDNKLLGTARLVNINYEKQSVEWGWGFDPNHWGDGYIFELMGILKSYIFENLKLNRLYGISSVDNKRSISALLGSGMQEEGVLRQHYRDYLGNYHDAWAYSLLSHEYLASKENDKNELSFGQSNGIKLEHLLKFLSGELKFKGLSVNDEMYTVPKWDSLTHITLMLALEDKFKIKFSPIEITQCTSVELIFKTISLK